MITTLKVLAYNRFLNFELLEQFVKQSPLVNYMWNESKTTENLLEMYYTNTWYCDTLIEQFKTFCKKENKEYRQIPDWVKN